MMKIDQNSDNRRILKTYKGITFMRGRRSYKVIWTPSAFLNGPPFLKKTKYVFDICIKRQTMSVDVGRKNKKDVYKTKKYTLERVKEDFSL